MRDRLRTEIAAALKAQDRARLSALRLISAALQQRDLAASVAPQVSGGSKLSGADSGPTVNRS